VNSPKRLAVLLEGDHVATLEQTRASFRLEYLDDASHDTPLSLALARGTAYTGARVSRFVSGLLPEDANARAAIARQHGVEPSNLMGLLHAIGKDCAGAVQFCLESEVDETIARSGSRVPCSDADIEARLAALDMDEAASWTMPDEHWSLGGTQQKFALRQQNGHWFTAHGAEPTSHIVKPGIRRMRLQALAEHVTMAAAASLGIAAARTEYREFLSETALVVERFDRAPTPDGGLRRTHQEDVCQALGISEKYEDQGGPSVGQIARLFREHAATSAQAEDAVARFADMVIFNTVVAAPDAHARNYAVLLARDSVTLAPMYDAATGAPYPRAGGASPKVAMAIGDQFALDQITPDSWRAFARDTRLDVDYVSERVAYFASHAPEAILSALSQVKSADSKELASRMSEPLARLAQRLVTTLP
jgi:serine/threonine-protein kinase HipA